MINQQKTLLQRIVPHLAAILFFLTITFVYFSPVLDGKMLTQSDVTQYQGASREVKDFYEKEGESSAWTGSMFSGMPTYQIGVWGGSPNFLDYLETPLKALGSHTAGPVFTGMLMAYILFLLMGFKPSVSALGAIAYSLSSYNIIIIDAGHVTKAWAIAYIPLIIAGLMTLFRKKYLLGALLMALGLALQIKNNHLQITYYTGLLVVILYLGFMLQSLKAKQIGVLFKASILSVLALVLAILCNLGSLYANYEMSQESTRGTSELSAPSTSEKQSSGLDKEYAFAWSYGKSETLSLLIPNIHGGASGGKLGTSSNLYKKLKAEGMDVPVDGVQAYTYWGEQPFTSGPVYFGVIICFLALLGMLVIRSRMKWFLLLATVFFIFLSWGSNMAWFNDWFFYHFPMYNKFRAVSTALVIPALTILMLAVWGLNEFLTGAVDKKKLYQSLYISLGVVGGICFLFWAMPDAFFNFTSTSDDQWKSSPDMPEWFYSLLLADRKDLLSADALRSLIFVLFAGVILWGALKSKSQQQTVLVVASVLIALLVLGDLWNIDQRYLNDGKFQSKLIYNNQTFQKTVADKAILEDKSPSYRVLNMNNPFNESGTSYYHKSIGGYHAAKLKRYQELIDHRLQGEIGSIIQSFQTQNLDSIMQSFAKTPSLNMLNAKYIIYSPEQAPLINPMAMGNAWFVNEYIFAKNADEEIASLSSINPRETAVLDRRLATESKLSAASVSDLKLEKDSTASIDLISYKPNKLVYKSKTAKEQLAVFSEIYYANGWNAYVDGNLTPHFCANWTLRAMRVPAGEHEIEFRFEPHNYNLCRTVTTASSGLLVLVLVGMLGFTLFRKKEVNS